MGEVRLWGFSFVCSSPCLDAQHIGLVRPFGGRRYRFFYMKLKSFLRCGVSDVGDARMYAPRLRRCRVKRGKREDGGGEACRGSSEKPKMKMILSLKYLLLLQTNLWPLDVLGPGKLVDGFADKTQEQQQQQQQ